MTLGEKAYISLRHDILRGTFHSNQPLRLASLRARYGLGFSPLREALTRLTAERIVKSEALRGFRVAELSLRDLRDTMETRTFIETEALRRSIEQGTDSWETGVVSTLHALLLQSSRSHENLEGGIDALEERHRAFHRALISACGSPRMLDIFDNLYLGSVRYRLPSLGLADPKVGLSPRDLVAEHSEIAQAALARDIPRAIAALTAHYEKTTELLEIAHAGRMPSEI